MLISFQFEFDIDPFVKMGTVIFMLIIAYINQQTFSIEGTVSPSLLFLLVFPIFLSLVGEERKQLVDLIKLAVTPKPPHLPQ